MNIWKLGTKWGSDAPSFYEYIKEKGIIISHRGQSNPKKGDYMLLTDDFSALAIAVLKEEPRSVTENEELKEGFLKHEIEYEEEVIYAAADYRILSEAERFEYKMIKGIVEIRNEKIVTKIKAIMAKNENPEEEINLSNNMVGELDILYQSAATGIEEEVEEYPISPFNPEDISIISKNIGIETCLRRLEQGTINLNPDFQRNEVWNITRKSQLIESLMLKIPLPMFYVSADTKGNFTVVDGLQRLSTIRDFVLGQKYLQHKKAEFKGLGFELTNLEFWTEYNGKNFNGLPVFIQNRILETEFSFTIINPGTPEEVKRNIFKRINIGGLPLSSQEIRNALYSGPSTKLLNRLAETKEFKAATADSIKPMRMDDRELILRFLAFWVRDYQCYQKTLSVDSLLSYTMMIINDIGDGSNRRDLNKAIEEGNINPKDIRIKSIEEIEIAFKAGMQRALQLFGRHCFRKSYDYNRRTPINKSLFEMWGVLLAELSESEFNTLLSQKSSMMKEYIPLLENADFYEIVSKNSMSNTAVQKRFQLISKLIKNNIS